MNGIASILKRITIDQWMAIDTEYIQPHQKTNLKGMASLMLAVFLLAVKRYYGGTRTFRIHFGSLVSGWKFPYIWAHVYGSFSALILFFLIPALFIRFVYGEHVRDHGFRTAGIWKYRRIYIVLLAIVMPSVFAASFAPSFMAKYPLYSRAGNSWAQFLIYESAYIIYFIALEFFFRGFMLFTVARYVGSYAIFIMVIPYVMIHFGKPFAETIGAIIAGIALGTLALRTRSIFGGVLIHVTVALSMDVLAIAMRLWRN